MESDLIVVPGDWLLFWVIWTVVVVPCAIVCAAKGRWGWFWLGFVSGGLTWVGGALLLAMPKSLWFRHVYDDAKRLRALDRTVGEFPTA